MAKTRSQTGNITIKKEEEDRKPNPVLHNGNNARTRGKITKRKPPKSNNKPLPARDVKIEEDTDAKSLLQSSSNYSNLPKGQQVSQEKLNRLIDAIVNNNMGITKAARKVNMCRSTATCYYNQYKNALIGYIVNNKMSIAAASRKAEINGNAANYFYHKYFDDQNPAPSHITTFTYYTQEQMKEVIGYIIDDKMTLIAASKKANINYTAVKNHYRRYLKDKNMEYPVSKTKPYTQDEIKQFIRYITDDKMSLTAASKKANMNFATGKKYYRKYLNGQKRDTSI